MNNRDSLEKFYKGLTEEVNAEYLARVEEGATHEQVFTELALNMLSDVGEAEDYVLCYDERTSISNSMLHKLNAYSFSENSDTLNLYITYYTPSEVITSLPRAEADRYFNKLSKFVEVAIFKQYYQKIEESSEVYQLALALATAQDLKNNLSRVCFTLITSCDARYDRTVERTLHGYSIILRVVDINYLFNISDKERTPIIIDQTQLGVPLPCITTSADMESYQSFLAIIPGSVLSNIYELYGLRLLEQNVRSFLQFTTKINKGIRNTILNEPNMFLAFNNGISATADDIEFVDLPDNSGKGISKILDFQIVNGGQTTTAIYQMAKKNTGSVSSVYVPMKLTIIKDKRDLDQTVARIAEYANTQNKISVSDLSSNKKSLIELENLSRFVFAPPQGGSVLQTRWFFERARGQYKNERNRVGATPARKKKFDLQNPRSQMFTKELLGKYLNTWAEIKKGQRIVIGPHVVVQGSQKNYSQFMAYNFPEEVTASFFQALIAKAILFKTAEKVYGTKPNSIGDLRYITVPYSLALIAKKSDYKIDLHGIWQRQNVDDIFEKFLYNLMVAVETFIKNNSPGSLYGQWAKDQGCWIALKEADLDLDFGILEAYTHNGNTPEAEILDMPPDDGMINQLREEIRQYGAEGWENIAAWLRNNRIMEVQYYNIAKTISKKLKERITFNRREILMGSIILRKISEECDFLGSLLNDDDEDE